MRAMIDGRFELGAPRPDWGAGEAYDATNTVARQPVVLKRLRAPGIDPVPPEVFQRTAVSIQRLGHAHIVGTRGHGYDEGAPFLVYAPADGQSLARWIERHRLEGRYPELSAVRGIFDAVCMALGAAHRTRGDGGVVHGLLTACSVLVAERDIAVLDFGLGALTRGAWAAWFSAPAWDPRAPEQIASGAVLTPAVDVFALGVLLAHMLAPSGPTNGPPSWGNFVERRDADVAGALRQLRGDLSASVCEVVAGCLKLSPGARFADVDRLRGAVRRADWNPTGDPHPAVDARAARDRSVSNDPAGPLGGDAGGSRSPEQVWGNASRERAGRASMPAALQAEITAAPMALRIESRGEESARDDLPRVEPSVAVDPRSFLPSPGHEEQTVVEGRTPAWAEAASDATAPESQLPPIAREPAPPPAARKTPPPPPPPRPQHGSHATGLVDLSQLGARDDNPGTVPETRLSFRLPGGARTSPTPVPPAAPSRPAPGPDLFAAEVPPDPTPVLALPPPVPPVEMVVRMVTLPPSTAGLFARVSHDKAERTEPWVAGLPLPGVPPPPPPLATPTPLPAIPDAWSGTETEPVDLAQLHKAQRVPSQPAPSWPLSWTLLAVVGVLVLGVLSFLIGMVLSS